MRRIILVALVLVLGIFGYVCFTQGFDNSMLDIEIYSLEDVKKESKKMSEELSAYNEKNEKQYEGVKTNLNVAIKDYENTKNEYQDLVVTLGLDQESTTEDVLEASQKAYQIDFLFAIIGNYARAENSSKSDLDLDLVFVESSSVQAPENAGYIYANLKFDVKGNYMKIADFIYDLEDDDRLGYEIRDFQMMEGHAIFTVYNVPIESSTLSMTSTNSGVTDVPSTPTLPTTPTPSTTNPTTTNPTTTNTATQGTTTNTTVQ